SLEIRLHRRSYRHCRRANRLRHRQRRKSPPSKSWIKCSSKRRLERRPTKHVYTSNGARSRTKQSMILILWPGVRMQKPRRQTSSNDSECAPTTPCYTIGCGQRRKRLSWRTTITRRKRNIGG